MQYYGLALLHHKQLSEVLLMFNKGIRKSK